jgi:hypothetical protein
MSSVMLHTCSLLADDRGVGTRANDNGTSDSARDHYDLLSVAEHGAGEGCQGRNGDRGATRAAGSAGKQDRSDVGTYLRLGILTQKTGHSRC